MELIHIECGIFNGIANFKVGDKILRFELCTPNYNDFGEFRVQVPLNADYEKGEYNIKVLPFDEKYVGYKPFNIKTSIEISDFVLNWWLDANLLSDTKDWEVCGGNDEENNFVVYDSEWIKYSEWLNKEHEPYEALMYRVLELFFNWYKSGDCNPTNGLMIYCDL